MTSKWEGKYLNFIPTRYPYTYSYDLLRQLRPIEGENSRGDMSSYVTDYCKARGLNKEVFCEYLADIYIEHAISEYEADVKRNRLVAAAFTSEYKEV